MLLSVLAVTALALSATGCVGTAMLGAAGAVASGAQFSKAQLAQKTFSYSRDDCELAAKDALESMEIKLGDTMIDDEEVTVHGETTHYPVMVDLEPITPCLTKVTVTAGKTYFTLDRSTGEAIVDRIGEKLAEREQVAANRAALAQAKQAANAAEPEKPETNGFRLYPGGDELRPQP